MMQSAVDPGEKYEGSSVLQTTTTTHELPDDEEALNTPLAKRLRARDEKPGAKRLRISYDNSGTSEDEVGRHDQQEKPSGVNDTQETEYETQSQDHPLKKKKKVRFLLEVAPVHIGSKFQHVVKRAPPPPPPPVPAGFFDKTPIMKPPKDLPPAPTQPAPPVHPAVYQFPPQPLPQLEGALEIPAPPYIPLTSSNLPPREPIFTPAADGDTYVNKTAFKLYSRLMQEIADFVEFQNNVTKKRTQAQERRMYLKLQRAYIRQCDTHLFEQVQEGIASDNINEDDLMLLIDSSQKARDDVIPLEDYYEALELELGADEFALRERLGKLEYRYESFFKLHGTSISTAPVPSNFSFESESSVEGKEDKDTSPQGRYRTAVGYAIPIGETPTALANAQETTVDAETMKPKQLPRLKGSDGVSEPISFRHSQHASHTRPENEHIAATLVALRDQEVPQDIAGIGFGPLEEDQISTWESLFGVQDPSLLYEHPNRVLEEILLDSTFTDSDPLLLRGSDGDTQSTLSEYLLDFESTRDRVNKWLLHKLRVSPREVFELQRQVQSSQPTAPDWANVVLKSWNTVGIGFDRGYHAGSESWTEQNEKVDITPVPYPALVATTPSSRTTRSSRSRRRKRRSLSLQGRLEPSTIDLLRKDIEMMQGPVQTTDLVNPMLQPVA
ncbi:hypothetical protein K491DRAFT_774867 [Lophiostoma macrostomum CBS 122681]|uniref:Uncharacterized protein n=1 Tax=Lophiostoma macrostomum CBS 122681 TaxID=1314788 RepID=A0A6A6TLS8_9PLEO|nr:hypothetical protein K491DRAFT_774867 [Lophiostoma macrostomum CBS 122681]